MRLGGHRVVPGFEPEFLRSENSVRLAKRADAHIAQSVEHFLGKEEVIGSNPIVSTIFRPRTATAVAVVGGSSGSS